MLKNVILTLIGIFFYLNSFSQNYFQKYQSVADSLETVYGIPSSVILAIAYYESGGGKSAVAKHSNNHFGIKGKNTKVNSSYKYYESVLHSYVGFCGMITRKKFYSNLKGNNDANLWITSISNTGYASNASAWSKKILSIIKTQNLT